MEELLSEYEGTLLVVSHDRSFLDRTVTSTLVFTDDARVEEHVGGYSDWRRHRDAMAAQVTTAAPVQQKSRSPNRSADRATTLRPGGSGAADSTAAAARRLSYKDQRELDQLPARIEALEAQQAAQVALTVAADFYQQEQAVISRELKRLAELEAELAAAYARWEALEEGTG